MAKQQPAAAAGGGEDAIVWKEEAGRFQTADGEAFLEYRLLRPSASGSAAVMDMVHTYVPRSKRGLGIAARLCDAAFAHADRHAMRVVPTCSYISDTYLPRNPAWSLLVYKEEEPKASM